MESEFQHHHPFIQDYHQQQQHHQKQMNSGLTRYQSAPSSYFSGFLDRDFCDEFLNRPSSPETERIFARLLASTGGNTENVPSQNFSALKPDSPVKEEVPQVNQQPQINDTRLQRQSSNYSASQSFYQSQSKPPLPDHNSGSAMDYRMVTPMGMERLPQMKSSSSGNNSNLVRHSSSPAGLFSDINIEMENGYAVLRGMADYGTANRETSYSAASRPPAAPPSGRMSLIAEIGNKENSSDNYAAASFSIASWDDASVMSSGAKRLTDDDRTPSGLNTSETQNAEAVTRPPLLAHHLSLPKTSAEFSAIEKYLQLQDSVPCKIRAKRGCATHPRSIAERICNL
ncbi:transcription factor bHLH122 isoform X2 [Jatropha curcas]|uniref:transcription factor bHLH122 isoform X2 n=1 Tax=Jatropha curcas TaxID=180498 RepID=UPI0009D6CC12|nr:transcription factor bHLH122 isoform X2 [Jatropha curcas]